MIDKIAKKGIRSKRRQWRVRAAGYVKAFRRKRWSAGCANSKNAMVPLTTVNTKNPFKIICGGTFQDLEGITKGTICPKDFYGI